MSLTPDRLEIFTAAMNTAVLDLQNLKIMLDERPSSLADWDAGRVDRGATWARSIFALDAVLQAVMGRRMVDADGAPAMMHPLVGDALDAFRDALDRLVSDYVEAMQLAKREPASVEDWRAGFTVQNEAWQRMGESIVALTFVATGCGPEDLADANAGGR
jgi:hypothetical protein